MPKSKEVIFREHLNEVIFHQQRLLNAIDEADKFLAENIKIGDTSELIVNSLDSLMKTVELQKEINKKLKYELGG